MSGYDATWTLKRARREYFSRNGFPPDGGYDARWVKVTRNRLPLYLLNTAPRRRAVPYHDIHHVLTGYETDNTGEAEISAWEIASGTGSHWIALLLDLAGMATGLFLAPRATFRAFVRGRGSGSLYRERLDQALLSQRVGEVRARLGLDRPPGMAGWSDGVLFAGYSLVGLLTLVCFVLFAPLLLLVGWALQ